MRDEFEKVIILPVVNHKIQDVLNERESSNLTRQRMSNYDPETIITEEKMMASFGITQETLDDAELERTKTVVTETVS